MMPSSGSGWRRPSPPAASWCLPERSDALRLVHGELDGLPGLIVDRYADTLVAQFLSSGAERWKETLADLLMELTGAERLYERSDADVRRLEGLAERSGVLRGDAPPQRLQIHENGLKFWVDVAHGHKTGHYLDQRDNRLRLRQLAGGKRVLDCFAYTGGFTAHALAGGAEVGAGGGFVRGGAGAGAGKTWSLNELPIERVEWLEGDVFQVLRGLRDRGRSFDLIVLDPPKFAPTAAHARKAARGYKDINLLAFKLLTAGGLAVYFFLLRRGQRRAVPEDRGRRGAGRGRGGADHRDPAPGARSSGGAEFPRGDVFEGVGGAGEDVGAVCTYRYPATICDQTRPYEPRPGGPGRWGRSSRSQGRWAGR